MPTAKTPAPAYPLRPVAELAPYARNSRTHSPAQIALVERSIEEFGYTMPVAADATTIIGGHARVEAVENIYARGGSIRWPNGAPIPAGQIPTLDCAAWSEDQKRAYVIADNQLALASGWDDRILGAELQALTSVGFDLGMLGFGDKELTGLLAIGNSTGDGKTGDDDVPDDHGPYTSVRGDVWLLGNHRLVVGDATSRDDVDALMAGSEADLVWTDPPYNVAVKGSAGSILNDDMETGAFRIFLDGVYASYAHAMRPGACIYVAHAESERAAFTQALLDAGLKLSQTLIWVKHAATLTRQDYNWQHEPILYGWKEGAGHYFAGDFTLTSVVDYAADIERMKLPELREFAKALQDAVLTTVIRHDRPTKSDLHPTMKPVALVERMIQASSRPGEIVLDLFGGSGTTIIAAEKTGRRAFLMELDPRFADVIVRRWEEFTGRVATLVSADGSTFRQIRETRLAPQPKPEPTS